MELQVARIVILAILMGIHRRAAGFLNILQPNCGGGPCQGPRPPLSCGPGLCLPQGPRPPLSCGPGPCLPQGPFLPFPGGPCGQGGCPQPPVVMKPYGWQYGNKGQTAAPVTPVPMTPPPTAPPPTAPPPTAPAPTETCIQGGGLCTESCPLGDFTETSTLPCPNTDNACCVRPAG